MYRHGLGDCFLLSFPDERGSLVHMLIDCGVVLGTSEPGTVMKRVAADIKKETGGTVDVLVITHEHWDHLSGFDEGQARSDFSTFDFKALWLAWTEQEGNPLADHLREEREKKKKAAQEAKKKAEEFGLADRAARLEGILGFFGARAANGGSDDAEEGGGTAGALAFLKSKCEPTIMETGGKPQSIPGAAGIRVYVLGPPMDADALKRANPRKDEGYGLAGPSISLADAFLAAFSPKDECGQPFASNLRQPLADLKKRLLVRKKTTQASPEGSKPHQNAGLDWYADGARSWRNIDNAWLETGERLALQLDSATNNTSLVLAFEFVESQDVLLFVGDAQAGNWRSWDDCEWLVKDKDGEQRKVTAADLLRRTVFYKVGHHGSHNATLREKGLERMTSGRLAAVIPVDTGVAHEVKSWKHMPLPAIQKRLKERCAIVFQSDKEPIELRNVPNTLWMHSAERFDVRMRNAATKKVETVREQPLYTDYFA